MTMQVVVAEGAVEQILSSPAVRAEIERIANQIAHAAGPGFEVEVEQRGDRVGAMVWAKTVEAKLAEHYDRALTRAIDAGRS